MREFKSEAESKTIRNVFAISYLYYVRPGSKPWKRFRNIRLATWAIFIPTLVALAFAFLFIDVQTFAQGEVEWIGIGIGILGLLILIGFANVDALLVNMTTLLALFDFLCTVVVIVLLLIFGQGFVAFGSIYAVNMYLFSYTAPTFGVAGVLNSRSNPPWAEVARFGGILGLLCCAVLWRLMIFLKQFSVTSSIVLLEIVGEEPITLRSVWEFFADVLVVRMLAICLGQLRQPMGALPLGQAHAVLTRSV